MKSATQKSANPTATPASGSYERGLEAGVIGLAAALGGLIPAARPIPTGDVSSIMTKTIGSPGLFLP